MKNLTLIAVIVISFSSFAQEIKVSNPIDQNKEERTWELETKDNGYVLHLPGAIGTNGHYIEFVNKAELKNFFNKALEMFEIDLPEDTFEEAEIDWTKEYLKFCTSEGSKEKGYMRSQNVSMSKSGYNLDNVFIRSYIVDTRKHHLTTPSGSSYFTKEEIVVLLEYVTEKKVILKESKVADEIAKEVKRRKLNALLGEIGSGSNYRLGNRKALTMPKPIYDCNEQGRVYVNISVDQSGKVIGAQPGVKGTTNIASCLLSRAKEAALKTRFNLDSNAPTKQVGIIIYNFSLN